MSKKIVKTEVCARDNCTLCMACVNACPKNAIYLGTDSNNYETILIDSEKCIECNICSIVCERRKKVIRNTAEQCYAAQAINRKRLRRSASGGAFQMLGEVVLEGGGVCYGCELFSDENGFGARHIRVDSIEDLHLILNSKYIPSIIGESYSYAKKDLLNGKLVLFSGTPCQIQGLKAFLGNDFENLITVDIICHGVTSTGLFNDYIKELERRNKIKVVHYFFRDKSISWGTNFCYDYYKLNDKEKRIKTRHCPREESSYMLHYLRGNIFRENCYNCALSCSGRVSDLTLGDYWEIEVENPEFITKIRPKISLRRGVSCILANTKKGELFADKLTGKMVMQSTSLEKIVRHNGNLQKPSSRGKDRDKVLSVYSNDGYGPIEENYIKSVGKKIRVYRFKNFLKSYLPDRARILIYNSPKLRKIIFK